LKNNHASGAGSHLSQASQALRAGIPVLTPNLRMARSIAALWSRSLADTQAVTVTPCVTALGAWLESQWLECVEAGLLPLRRVLTPAEAEELWLSVIKVDMAARPDFSLVEPMAAARLAHRSREALLHYRADFAKVRPAFLADPDCARFWHWLVEFEAALAGNALCTPADVERSLLALETPRVSQVHLFDDESFTPLSRAALQSVAADITPIPPLIVGGEWIGVTYENAETEMAAAAAWAAARHRAKAGSTALVLPDLADRRGQLDRALREAFGRLAARYDALPVNYSRGVPYASTPMYRDLLTALRVLDGPVARRDAVALLRSPYLAPLAGVPSGQRLQLIERIHRLASDPVAAVAFRDAVLALGESPLGSLLDRLGARGGLKTPRSAEEWRRLMTESLELLRWPSRADLDSYEFQQRESLGELFDAFERAASIHEKLSYGEALAVLARVMQRRQFQPSTPNDAIQVLNLREVRGLAFDAVWLLGAQSGLVPERPDAFSFIPAAVKRALNLPAVRDPEGLENARQLIGGLAALTNELHISWRRFEQGVEQLPSPLLTKREPAQLFGAHVEDRWRSLLPSGSQLLSVEDWQTEPLAPDTDPVRGGSRLLSDQSQCPFKAWLAHRVRIRGLEPRSVGLSPAEKGSLLHRTLQLVWEALGDSDTLRSTPHQVLVEMVDQHVAAALRELKPSIRARVGQACLAIEAQRLASVVQEWLGVEANRAQSFQVVATEVPRELQLGALSINLVVDRIDELADGRQLVVDYKSSDRFSSRYWWGERLREPQLPSYALLDSETEGIAWAVIARRKKHFVAAGESLGLGSDQALGKQLGDEEIADWQQVKSGWQSRLQNLAEEFLQGHAVVEPMKDACRYCDYRSVCRVDEVVLEVEEDVQ
jgi:probable DNA repair protein